MANTSAIKTTIEPAIRRWLESHFPGHQFTEQVLSGYKFDAVAKDGSIVCAILCNRPRTRTGNENTGAVRKALNDLSYLKLLPMGVKKLMVFTDAGFCELIRRRAARLGPESIEMRVCELPDDLKPLLEQILDQASYEQRAAE